MTLIAFIQRDQKDVIDKILNHLNLPRLDLEDQARGPPLWFRLKQAQEHLNHYPLAYPEENLDQSAHLDEEALFLDPP